MKINDLRPSEGSVKKRRRIGRGVGSGHGTTAGRGTKGQLARSGGKTRPGFEGGQMPLQRRIPRLKGFKNNRKVVFDVINVEELEVFKDEETVDKESFRAKGLIKKSDAPVKILGGGDLKKKLTVKADHFSKGAKEKIEKSGGKAEVI